jgi:hypothetical protein
VTSRDTFLDLQEIICLLYSKQCWLVGDHLLLRDFGPCVTIFTNVCVITGAMVQCSFAVKGFWAL